MIASRVHLITLVLLWFGANLYGQAPAAPPKIARYPGIRTQFNQSLSQAETNEQRLIVFREVVAQGRYSGRPMLMRMFGNFEPPFFNLSPTTPGLYTTVRKSASDNPYVVKGDTRTVVYANSLNVDGRFKVLGLNRPRINSAGATDADIVFRHQPTGLQVRMEVKNMTPASQRADRKRLQSQIVKMAQDARLTGELQVWANRQPVLPAIRDFAQRHGITVAERLRTGSTNLRPEDLAFRDFANVLDKQLRVQARLTALGGGVQMGMGAYMAYQAIRQLKNDLSSFGGAQGDLLRLGEHGSILLAGGGFSVAGTARLIQTVSNSSRLVSLTKWGGRVGMAGTVLAEGFLVSQYMSGDLTERQFWHGQASLGGGLAGGAAGGFVGLKGGALIGGAIGSFFPGPGTLIGAGIGGTVGAIGGGIGGGYAGSHFAGRGVESLYQLQDREQQEKYAQYLLLRYQSH